MMIGLPGSGKSTFAETIGNNETIILSSDKLRNELYSDENDQKHNTEVFKILHERARKNLLAGRDVVYDATNINKKQRADFLKSIDDIQCNKEAVCMMTPYKSCLKFNEGRDRFVPEHVIDRMYKKWNPPHGSEGFDRIQFVFNDCNERMYNLYDLFYGRNGIMYFDQETHFHNLTLGNHCVYTEMLIRDKFPDNIELQYAALLHDIGKVYTKSFLSSDGKTKDKEAHYYFHNCVSAYESAFYSFYHEFSAYNIAHIANVIYYHMRPYFAWKDRKKEERDRIAIGEEIHKDVIRLHYADVAAH